MIGWTLANVGEATLEYKSSLFLCHPDACNTTLAPASSDRQTERQTESQMDRWVYILHTKWILDQYIGPVL